MIQPPAPASPRWTRRMETLRTALRLVVMLMAIGIGYKAWQHYGPPAEQVKSLALRALDAARSALDSESANRDQGASLSADPRPMAIAPALAGPAPPATGQVLQAQALVPVNVLPSPMPIEAPAPLPPSRLPPADPPANVTADTDPLKPLYARLEQLGARDQKLSAWGARGELSRFSCQASFAGIENFNRHFDAVAAEPRAAVEAVLAKVEAWQTSQSATAQAAAPLR